MKLGLLAAGLVLVAGGAVGCGDDGDGGGGGGSDTASKADFCQAFQDFYDDLTSITGEEENLGKILKDAARVRRPPADRPAPAAAQPHREEPVAVGLQQRLRGQVAAGGHQVLPRRGHEVLEAEAGGSRRAAGPDGRDGREGGAPHANGPRTLGCGGRRRDGARIS